MKKLTSAFEILPIVRGEELTHIERIGRVCYKSEDKISEDGSSAVQFVQMLKTRKHFAMLEHSVFVFRISGYYYSNIIRIKNMLESELGRRFFLNYTRIYVDCIPGGRCTISGNLRAWYEFLYCLIKSSKEVALPKVILEECQRVGAMFNDLELDHTTIEWISDPNSRYIDISELESDVEHDTHTYTSVWMRCDRGVSHELVRHRPGSPGQESTRYCNYSKSKFEGSISILDISAGITLDKKMQLLSKDVIKKIKKEWHEAMLYAEEKYLNMIALGATPQIARSVLPNSTKTEICYTANIAEWKTIFHLRTAEDAHPQMRELMIPIQQEFIKRGLVHYD